jgi:hypothetical protein
MKRLWSAAAVACLVLVGVFQWQNSTASAQGSVQACMNPNSGEIKALVKSGCNPGWVALSLSTGGSGDGRGPRVVDAGGDDVGAYMGHAALRYVAPYWLLIVVNKSGIRTESVSRQYLFSDCVGDAYLRSDDNAPLAPGAHLESDGQLHFVGDPITFEMPQSVLFPDGSCHNFSDQGFFGREASVPVPAGLDAPFDLVDP